jgi:hypothetical protein
VTISKQNYGNSPGGLMLQSVIVCFRGCPTQYVDGKPLPAKYDEFSIRGNVQPMGGRDLLLVPEADRFKEQYFIWTFGELRVGDIVRYCADPSVGTNQSLANFQVQNVEMWAKYRKARIMRCDVGVFATP